MKVTIKTSALKTSVSNMQSLFDTTLGVWGGEVLLTAADDKLTVEYSGGGYYYKQAITANVEKRGKLAINVTHLARFNFPSDSVTFLTKEGSLMFASGRMKGKLDSLGEGDPITRIKSKLEDAITIPAKLFSRLADNILFKPTVADQSLKMRFISSKKKQTFAAFCLDEYRVAKYDYGKPKEGGEEQKAPKEKEKGKQKKKEAKTVEVMKIEIKGDFDYVFSGDTLGAIKGMFQGDLNIAADEKIVRFRDSFIELYYPSASENIGKGLEDLMQDLESKEPIINTTFHPEYARVLIDSACSVNQQEDGRITLIPNGEKQMRVNVTGDGIRTQCTFDLLSLDLGKKKEPKVIVSAPYFLEFLQLIKAFADDKKGIRMKIWKQGRLCIQTKGVIYVMPTHSKSDEE